MLEDLAGKLRRREATEGEVALLVVLCRGVWNSVASALRRASSRSTDTEAGDPRQREEVARVNQLDRDALDHLIVSAMLSAVAKAPSPFPRRFFPWLKETLAHRALDYVRDETVRDEVSEDDGNVLELIDAAVGGELGRDARVRRKRPVDATFSRWLGAFDTQGMIAASDEFASYVQTRSACMRAVEKLARGQRNVIEAHYFEDQKLVDIAAAAGRSASTTRNTHAKALGNLRRDDKLFSTLQEIGKVRDRRRAEEKRMRLPAAA